MTKLRIIGGITLFVIGFPIAVLAFVIGASALVLELAASILKITELALSTILDFWRGLFVRLYGLDK